MTKYRSYSVYKIVNGVSVRSLVENSSWEVSPRVGGKLRLQSNACSLLKDQLLRHSYYGNPPRRAAQANSEVRLPPGFSWDPLYNEAYAKFVGKLRHGSAAVGVTAGSWSQSRDMIVKRCNIGRAIVNAAIRGFNRSPSSLKKARRNPEKWADNFLEVEFGWLPLISDLKACLETVCQHAIPDQFVGARTSARVFYETSTSYAGDVSSQSYLGFVGVSQGARVAISNPNLWLANRLGILNPGTTIWDLVPWSFVVNMFVNVDAIINSVTDTVGLTLDSGHTTRRSLVTYEDTAYRKTGFSSSVLLNKRRYRVSGTIPRPTLEFKVPNVNWELAAIASSLLVQRLGVLGSMVRL